ncbi:hypothetical protein [uncultured Victivallis sp.]|nr:hypothetical protein [uncultured Victivallis sp.]
MRTQLVGACFAGGLVLRMSRDAEGEDAPASEDFDPAWKPYGSRAG